jgi:hypothetical protein
MARASPAEQNNPIDSRPLRDLEPVEVFIDERTRHRIDHSGVELVCTYWGSGRHRSHCKRPKVLVQAGRNHERTVRPQAQDGYARLRRGPIQTLISPGSGEIPSLNRRKTGGHRIATAPHAGRRVQIAGNLSEDRIEVESPRNTRIQSVYFEAALYGIRQESVEVFPSCKICKLDLVSPHQYGLYTPANVRDLMYPTIRDCHLRRVTF